MNFEIYKSDSITYHLKPSQWFPITLRTKSRLRKALCEPAFPGLCPQALFHLQNFALCQCLCPPTCHRHSSHASSFLQLRSQLRHQPSEATSEPLATSSLSQHAAFFFHLWQLLCMWAPLFMDSLTLSSRLSPSGMMFSVILHALDRVGTRDCQSPEKMLQGF